MIPFSNLESFTRESKMCIRDSARTAEDTASCIDQSVPVGAGKAAVKGNLKNLVPVPGLHLVIERVVTLF